MDQVGRNAEEPGASRAPGGAPVLGQFGACKRNVKLRRRTSRMLLYSRFAGADRAAPPPVAPPPPEPACGICGEVRDPAATGGAFCNNHGAEPAPPPVGRHAAHYFCLDCLSGTVGMSASPECLRTHGGDIPCPWVGGTAAERCGATPWTIEQVEARITDECKLSYSHSVRNMVRVLLDSERAILAQAERVAREKAEAAQMRTVRSRRSGTGVF